MKATEKTNIEHLRAIIVASNLTSERHEEAMEFLTAIEDEQTQLSETIREKDSEISSNEEKISELEMSLESDEGLDVIDCGYGKIWYRTDNLKLQSYMESLTERLEQVGV